MASFVTDLAKPYVEKLINGVMKESRYICCFTCIAKDFEEEKVRLKVEKTTVEQRVEVAKRRGEDIQGNALFWEEEATKLMHEDTKTKQTCFFGFCPHCIWQYKRGKELNIKKERIKKLMETGNELAIGLPAHLPDVERYSSQHYISFKSREFKYKELLDALEDENNYIIGLQGMGGTGKTTLAKQVGKELKQSKQFTQIIDTTVSYYPDIKKIQDDIAGPLGLKWDDCSESDRPKKLWSRLTNGEKILLIFDDVWRDIDFDEIGIPHRDNHKGCRLLVTTRNMLVCNKMGCSKTIQLELLSKEDAWIMFKRYAGLSDTWTKSLFDKACKIANECKRLPVAIAAIASSLKGEQRQEEWDVALKSLQKHMSIHNVDDDLVKVYKCFKFSYDNMRDEKAKRLFLLCSVFQEDEEISTETLTRFSVGAGLFGDDYASYDDARSQVVISKNKLLDSCLLLEANQGSVKMHDLVRDAAQWIANKEIRTINLYDKNQKTLVERENNIKYFACEGKLMDVQSLKFDGSKLEILILLLQKDESWDDVKVLNLFFENNAELRVFHLFGNSYPRDQSLLPALSLPQSIQSLKNIRSLIFRCVNLGDISILGNLQILETLDLYYCLINELPHGITKLEKLRLLSLEFCRIERNNPFDVIEGCSSLEELNFINSFNDFCQEITFPKLQRYCVNEYWKSANDSTSSKYVSIPNNDEIFLSESTLKYCMQTAGILDLRRIEKGWKNIIPEIVPIDQGMNDLVEFHLRCISGLQCLIDTRHTESQVSNVFSKLVVLNLEKMENLEELCNGPLSFDSLKCLEKLSIMSCERFQSLFKCNLNLCNLKSMLLQGCPMLVCLFQQSTSRSLVLLERLEIIDCERLEYLLIDERNRRESREEIVDDDNSRTSHDSMFPKLVDLSIKKCPKLESILPFLSAHDIPALESIRISHCDKLKYIFGQDVELGSLKQMELDGLPCLIDIFPKSYGTMASSIKGPSPISIDTSKPQTQLDPIKCNIFSWSNIYCYGKKYRFKSMSTGCTKTSLVSEDQQQDFLIPSEPNSYCIDIWDRAQSLSRQSHIMCNIKEIQLSDISKMKSVFILSISPRMLLETLTIKNCDELKHIIIDTGDDSGGNNWGNVFPKLKWVSVDDCVQLENIFGHYGDDHPNQVEIHLCLPVLEELTLLNLPRLVGMCPKQYHTTFPSLKELVLDECAQVAVKSIGDFINHTVTKSVNGTAMKDFCGNVEHLLVLEKLSVDNTKVQSIFCLNEVNEQQMDLGLQNIWLYRLPMMTHLFIGPKNSFALQNLMMIKIVQCEKLQVIFSASILRCLPQLLDLIIIGCDELKHIIEDGLENKILSNSLSSRTCFPKLEALIVQKCNKLKCVFPISICNELPQLKALIIREADEVEEIFESEGIQKVKIPNLKFVAIVNLPSLCQIQGIQFQTLKYHFVQNCQKIGWTSASAPYTIEDVFDFDLTTLSDNERFSNMQSLFLQLRRESRGHNTGTKKIAVGIEVDAGHELTSSQIQMKQTPEEAEGECVQNVHALEMPSITLLPTNSKDLMNKQSMDQQCLMNQQCPLEETDTTLKPSLGNNLEGSTSKNTVEVTMSTVSRTKNESPIQVVTSKKEGIKISVEEGTTSTYAKTITSSTHLELISSSSDPLVNSEHKTTSQKYGDGDIPSFSISSTELLTIKDVVLGDSQENTKINNDQVSLHDAAFMKVDSNTEEQFPKDDERLVSRSRLSSTASQFPSIPSKGNTTQIVEDLSSSLLVTRELEQLVSKKHLDYENLSLLTDFLVKHPAVLLKDTLLSNRYKGYAYNCLAELLKFLQTHSVLDVLGSSHSEFVELVQDVRKFSFDKDWLDGVERHALFPNLQFSQDALRKLFDSKQRVTKEVEEMQLKINIFNQHVDDLKHQLTSSKAVLESIIQQEAQVLETKAALSAPLGYN